MLLDFIKWRPSFAEKHMKTFLEVTPQKGLHDLCGRKFVNRSCTNAFRASLGKFVQNSFAPPNFACSYTYEMVPPPLPPSEGTEEEMPPP